MVSLLLQIKLIQGSKPSQGLRINGKKQQIIRSFKDEDTGLTTIYGKVTQGGSCIVHAGRCILIATFSESKGHTSAGCNEILRLMGNYLCKSSWPEDDKGATGAGPSWQLYIEKMLVGKGNVTQAMILSKHDGKVFAATTGFAVSGNVFE